MMRQWLAALLVLGTIPFSQCFLVQPQTLSAPLFPTVTRSRPPTLVLADASSSVDEDTDSEEDSDVATISCLPPSTGKFDLTTALFCSGLAFDAYVVPPENSSRWEKGSQGLQVAFVSSAFARRLYKGILEVTVQRCTGLPEDDNGAERLITGKGVDAAILVAVVEGSWKEDIRTLEKEQFHEGVLDLTGAAHVVRTPTAWANVDEKKSQLSRRQRGRATPYHIPGGWGRGGQAVWPEEEPLFLYLQDPATARLVFTVLDDDRVGDGSAVGSTYKSLPDLIPQAALSPEELMESLKQELIEAARRGEIDLSDENSKIQLGSKTWQGALKLTSKPRKKDKNSQVMAGAVAGAYVAGPVGAAAGALLGSLYEGQVQGSIQLQLRYLPIAPLSTDRKVYEVKGGMPGIEWGQLYEKHLQKLSDPTLRMGEVPDLEHCFFVNHAKTGATCTVYRSLEQKLIVVSFRGTCAPVDLVTDTSLAQETWVLGEDVENQDLPKVHTGFRTSLESISRRLKELILATVAEGDSFSDYDMLVTGHSLGGALATLFTADIGQYGVDAGRGLPQMEQSEPWWKSVANTFMGQNAADEVAPEPPRPKSLRMYNFGSPRVGNNGFSDLFDALVEEGKIDEAYRIVNGDDVVARMPRTVNGLVFGQIRYEHVGTTVLISQPAEDADEENKEEALAKPLVWVEGESDDGICPVRDGVALSSPLAEGTLLSDIVDATKESWSEGDQTSITDKLSSTMAKFTSRMRTATASDVASIVGINKSFTDREVKLIQSLFQGKALAHHMEDQYYSGMSRGAGFLARVGEEIVELDEEVQT